MSSIQMYVAAGPRIRTHTEGTALEQSSRLGDKSFCDFDVPFLTLRMRFCLVFHAFCEAHGLPMARSGPHLLRAREGSHTWCLEGSPRGPCNHASPQSPAPAPGCGLTPSHARWRRVWRARQAVRPTASSTVGCGDRGGRTVPAAGCPASPNRSASRRPSCTRAAPGRCDEGTRRRPGTVRGCPRWPRSAARRGCWLTAPPGRGGRSARRPPPRRPPGPTAAA